MLKPELSVSMSERINSTICEILIRDDHQEDLLFCLWSPSEGKNRLTALVHHILNPEVGDRQVHGNASFNPSYFERVCATALKEKCGIAFLHSHPGPGWQGMSADDILAEKKMAGAIYALTNLPLVGMTVGSDGIWSARMWEHTDRKNYTVRWCHSVRVVGTVLKTYLKDSPLSTPERHERYKRTITVWGEENHCRIARLRIGIVGLGSVGSIVAESLARMGMGKITLIDFDEVQEHNLDRLLGATEDDLGSLKVKVAERQIENSATAKHVEVTSTAASIAEEEGYRTALDCDVLFSCVDRPRARHILNHFAYSHLIPVIDGGIEVRFNKRGEFTGVDWQLQTVAPGRPCLECLGTYNSTDVNLEANGLLDDPSYMKGLPVNHRLKNNENVFPFSCNLASLEILQFIALTTGAGGVTDFGVQRYRYLPGNIELSTEERCKAGCDVTAIEGEGDRYFHLYGQDLGAEAARERQEDSGSD